MGIAKPIEDNAGVAVGEGEDAGALVSLVPTPDNREKLRILEGLLFASSEPISEAQLASQLGEADDVAGLLGELAAIYENRGVNLVQIGGRWAFRTAEDLGYLLQKHSVEQRRLSRAALETLAIVAYHQPVTRAEIEEIRGVGTSRGTLDVLLETGWIRLRGRRRAPGRPVTYGTSAAFLDHFGLESIRDLPGLAELKGAGLLDSNLPPGFTVPEPMMMDILADDEDPLEDDELDLLEEEIDDDEEAPNRDELGQDVAEAG